MLALVTVKSAVGLGNGVLTVFPLLAGVYGVGSLGAGLLFAVRGAGALVGPILMRRVLTNRAWLLPGLALSMSLYGLAYLGAAVARGSRWCCCWSSWRTSRGGSNWVLSNFALQGEVPDRLRGRVFATDMMLATLAISVSQLAVAAAWWTGRRAGRAGRLRPDHRSSTRSAGGSPPAGCRSPIRPSSRSRTAPAERRSQAAGAYDRSSG